VAADPGLIACVFEAANDDANKLLSPIHGSSSLITQAVAGKAAEFGVAVIAPIELAKLIDDSLLVRRFFVGRSGFGVQFVLLESRCN
jgi:hypothetical protein